MVLLELQPGVRCIYFSSLVLCVFVLEVVEKPPSCCTFPLQIQQRHHVPLPLYIYQEVLYIVKLSTCLLDSVWADIRIGGNGEAGIGMAVSTKVRFSQY